MRNDLGGDVAPGSLPAAAGGRKGRGSEAEEIDEVESEVGARLEVIVPASHGVAPVAPVGPRTLPD